MAHDEAVVGVGSGFEVEEEEEEEELWEGVLGAAVAPGGGGDVDGPPRRRPAWLGTR